MFNVLLYDFSLMVLFFSVIFYLVFLILYYIFNYIILYSDNSKFILDLSNKRPLFGKIIKRYKNTRWTIIVIELLFFVLSTGGLIFISFIVLTKCFV